jgi:response regulator of citrate/malate metabolism
MLLNTTRYLNVLLIDDDEDDYFIMAKLISEIEEYKCSINWCYSYNTALDQLLTGQYHIALIDYRLGAKTGVQLIEDAILNGVDIPFILITGGNNPLVHKKTDIIGIVGYLLKTKITSTSLECAIRNALTGHLSPGVKG